MNKWRAIHAKLSSRVETVRTANDGNDQKHAILELNISFQEDNSLFNQFFSAPVIGMWNLC